MLLNFLLTPSNETRILVTLNILAIHFDNKEQNCRNYIKPHINKKFGN
jgi:hypothetical protein